MQPGAAARIDIDIQTFDHPVDLIEDGRLAGHAHQQLVLQHTRQQRLPEGVTTMGDGLDFKNRLRPDDIIGFGQVHKRPFGITAIEVDRAFQHKLRLGRDQQINRFSPDQLERFQGVGNLQLIDPQRHRHGCGRQHIGSIADAHRHVNLFQHLQISVKMAGANYPHGHFCFRKLHTAVKVGILAVFRVFGNDHPGTDIVTAVSLTVTENGQPVQIGLQVDHLLAGRLLDHLTRRAPVNGPGERRDEFRYGQAKIAGKGRFGAEKIANDPKFRFFDAFKQQRGWLQLFEYAGKLTLL